MRKTGSAMVALARSWLGKKEEDGSFRSIIDSYNAHTPLPRGVRMEYHWPWCACTWSALAIVLGYTDIVPVEISCNRLIALGKDMGIWQERDTYVPAPGDGILYDWEDAGNGENTGEADHIGIVESVSNGVITVIEGNYQNSVKRRTLKVGGRYIRGYLCPRYHQEPKEKGGFTLEMENLKKGAKGEAVRALQILLMGRGYSCGNSGADGIFGNDTDRAVRQYQKAKLLVADGIAGKNTFSALLGL